MTPPISKCVERILGSACLPQSVDEGAFGPNQFAYTAGRGARDALLVIVLRWLLAFTQSQILLLYCSDVSGAFDCVPRGRLVQKLRRARIPEPVVEVMSSWLGQRSVQVVVGGATSQSIAMSDMVFQGTVWGPPMWNIFFEDARDSVNEHGFKETVFAGDLNTYTRVRNVVDEITCHEMLEDCQRSLHEWGDANGARFDASKESFHILSRTVPFGNLFKILGILFDVELTMSDALHECVIEATWRVKALPRTKRFYSDADMIQLYKTNTRSSVEYRTPAIAHASSSHLDKLLDKLDRVLKRF